MAVTGMADSAIAKREAQERVMDEPNETEQRNTRGETAEQIIGAFMMHMGQAPWEAENLLGWLHRAGFEVVIVATESQGVLDAGGGEGLEKIDMEALLDAAEEVLCDRERIITPAEARLALIVHSARPQSMGKEACLCSETEKAECDECLPVADLVARLRALAAT
jgi:hypothetical protein